MNFWIPVANGTIYTLHFKDYILIAQYMDYTKYLIRKLTEEYDNFGLEINIDKTNYSYIGVPNIDLILNEQNK